MISSLRRSGRRNWAFVVKRVGTTEQKLHRIDRREAAIKSMITHVATDRAVRCVCELQQKAGCFGSEGRCRAIAERTSAALDSQKLVPSILVDPLLKM